MKKILSIFILFLATTIVTNATEIKFVQVDSTRFFANSDISVSNFKTLIKNINQMKNVSFVLFSGDNLAVQSQANLKSFIKNADKLNVPYCIALGHKDVNKKKGLSKEQYAKLVRKHSLGVNDSLNYVFTKKGVVFVVADGSKEVIATPFGYYKEDIINWIDKELTKYSKKNVIILQHFPVYPPAQQESYYTFKADLYMQMLSKHSNVRAIVSGFKINSELDVDGIKHITTAEYPQYRIIEIFDCETNNPTIWSTLK